jgi:hypothetical protein
MYTPHHDQPQPKRVLFNVQNWLIYRYIQFHYLLHTTESMHCVVHKSMLSKKCKASPVTGRGGL